MFLIFKKTYIENIEKGFEILKSQHSTSDLNKDNVLACELITESSQRIFPYKFILNFSYPKTNNEPFFGMSVYPEISTVDKIIDAINSGSSSNVIINLWKSNKIWNIEFDSRIFNSSIIDLIPRELTAIYCHELGHIISSNSVPTRISNILQYEIAKNNVTNKNIIRDKFFNKLLRLPILNACSIENSDSYIEEIKADKFAVKAGYKTDLISALRKFQNCKLFRVNSNPDKSMEQMSAFAMDAVEQFKRRESSLLESTLINMKENCHSEFLKESVGEIYDSFFNVVDKSEFAKSRKLDYLYEKAEKYCNDDFIALEFFGVSKTLKRIEPNEIDYIAIKMKSIQSDIDKIMLVTYAHNKLDIVEYYISLLNNPKKSKKYRIPYTMDELIKLKERLNNLINEIIEYKLPPKLSQRGILVAWPDGYEG